MHCDIIIFLMIIKQIFQEKMEFNIMVFFFLIITMRILRNNVMKNHNDTNLIKGICFLSFFFFWFWGQIWSGPVHEIYACVMNFFLLSDRMIAVFWFSLKGGHLLLVFALWSNLLLPYCMSSSAVRLKLAWNAPKMIQFLLYRHT